MKRGSIQGMEETWSIVVIYINNNMHARKGEGEKVWQLMPSSFICTVSLRSLLHMASVHYNYLSETVVVRGTYCVYAVRITEAKPLWKCAVMGVYLDGMHDAGGGGEKVPSELTKMRGDGSLCIIKGLLVHRPLCSDV